jgi:SH3-like domain-containing protein
MSWPDQTGTDDSADGGVADDGSRDPTRGGNGLLVISILILGALIAGFLLLRTLGGAQDGTPGPGSLTDTAATETSFDPASVRSVSPPELRRVTAMVEALSAPVATASVVGQLARDAAVDVTGRVEAGGVRWARVVLPGAGGRSGYVREDVLEPLADRAGSQEATDLDGITLAPGPAAPMEALPQAPVQPGAVEPMAPAVVYVASRRANIRAEASADSARLGQMVFGDTLMVVARQSVGERLWLQVQLPDGTSGWINAGLVASSRPEAPIDAASAQAPASTQAPASAPAAGPPQASPPRSAPGRSPLLPPLPPGEARAPAGREARDMAGLDVGSGPFGRGAIVAVQTPQANVRDRPQGTVIDRVSLGDRLKIQQAVQVEGRIWLRVTTAQGVTGWISSSTVAPD